MLKALDSGYGRARARLWKWKDSTRNTFDAVMLYAHPGHGGRSNLYTDYTFGVWRDAELVPIAKAIRDSQMRRSRSLTAGSARTR